MQNDVIRKNDPECCPILIDKNDTQNVRNQAGTIPAIRFRGFTDDWEQRKLGDVARILGGNAWKASDYSDDGEYLVVTIANVSGEVIINDSVGNRISCDNPDVYLLNKGDILVSLTGNVGRVSKMSNIKGLLNQRVGKILPNNSDINADFLFHVLRNPHFERAMIDAGQGAAQKNIRNDDVLNYAFFLPVEKDEQNIIAHYFNRLDHLITLHQRKYDETRELKKYMLQKMFPKDEEKVPEIRFQGFTGEWEKRKLGEIAPLRSGFAFKSNGYSTEGVPIIRISNILSNGTVGADFVYYDEQEKDSLYSLYDGAAVLAMSGATTGKVSILHTENGNKYYQNQRVGYFTPTENCDYRFVRTVVQSQLFIDQLMSVLVAGAQPNVSSKEIDAFEFMIPESKKEQYRIGLYFDNLDSLITLYQRKCGELKEIKQYMLQNMFTQKI